ncbi:unnamed protein product [Thlaspi arvense]|uniref:Uncharacterized protein n=1 Tax=Thlaspi arvense TaxID=13288 RepID=A0AAU9SDZ1_THLAR|nr:unnamed protein product [Thlaspi arvense]
MVRKRDVHLLSVQWRGLHQQINTRKSVFSAGPDAGILTFLSHDPLKPFKRSLIPPSRGDERLLVT